MDSFTEYFKESEETNLNKPLTENDIEEDIEDTDNKPKKKERKLRFNEIFDTKKKKKK